LCMELRNALCALILLALWCHIQGWHLENRE
jgi:hypothetical protein